MCHHRRGSTLQHLHPKKGSWYNELFILGEKNREKNASNNGSSRMLLAVLKLDRGSKKKLRISVLMLNVASASSCLSSLCLLHGSFTWMLLFFNSRGSSVTCESGGISEKRIHPSANVHWERERERSTISSRPWENRFLQGGPKASSRFWGDAVVE